MDEEPVKPRQKIKKYTMKMGLILLAIALIVVIALALLK